MAVVSTGATMTMPGPMGNAPALRSSDTGAGSSPRQTSGSAAADVLARGPRAHAATRTMDAQIHTAIDRQSMLTFASHAAPRTEASCRIGYTRPDDGSDRFARSRFLRTSGRTLHAVVHRDVGALQLLRHARLPHSLHDRAGG